MVPKCVLCFVFASVLAFSNGQNVSIPPPEPVPHTTPPHTTIPTTTPTTTIPTTTTPTTTTPTTPTTTTTTKPTTPTAPPNTTVAPTTSSAAPPTTPKPPKPTPGKPEVGSWNVTAANVTCVMATMAVQFNISYRTAENAMKYGILNVPKNSTATGLCGNVTQVLTLMWPSVGNTTNSMSLKFVNKSEHFMIDNITLVVNPSDPAVFPDIKDKNITMFYSNKTEFSTPMSKSYLCAKEQKFELHKNGSNMTEVTIDVSHVQLQAFHKDRDGKFGAAENCEDSSNTDVVPIAVGCALVGLVAVVLIAYLVGRRRSQARGYLSM